MYNNQVYNEHYFQRCSILTYIIYVIVFGTLFYLVTQSPLEFISESNLVGQILSLLHFHYQWEMKVLLLGTFVGHTLECWYSVRIARELNLSNHTTLKWALQTFVLGFPSLLKILEYHRLLVNTDKQD